MHPAAQHFKRHDSVMFRLAETFGVSPLTPKDDFFLSLCESIVSQQLSVKASDTIFKRFLALVPHGLNPENILSLDHAILRTCGLSNAKTVYIKDLALCVHTGRLQLEILPRMNDEEVIHQLTQVKGIGRWTAEMFLMFALGREDIFSYGDLGLRNAIGKLYEISEKKRTQAHLEPLVNAWSPYRTHAARLLWKSLDNTPPSAKNE